MSAGGQGIEMGGSRTTSPDDWNLGPTG